jgi:lysophospholipase L1-like esterase
MKRLSFLLLLASTTLTFAADAPAKKRLLILGDSISIGYTPIVQKMLAGEWTVVRPMRGEKAENCSGTTYGVANMDRWLQLDGGKWDVIHFNWGLHDLKHVKAGDPKGAASDSPTDPPQATVELYEKNLREIVAKLKATGAKLIFATTTPVPEGKMAVYRTDADAVKYNTAALKVMKENNIAVDDLYAFVKPQMAKIQRQPANVHFTEEGSQALAKQVIASVKAVVK